MAEFYRFPHWTLITLVMVVALCIVLQTLAISYSIRRLRTGWARRAENGMECVVLAALFLFAALLGQVQYGLYGGFLLPSAYGLARQMVFLLRRRDSCAAPSDRTDSRLSVSLLFPCGHFLFLVPQRAHLHAAAAGALYAALFHIRQGGH